MTNIQLPLIIFAIDFLRPSAVFLDDKRNKGLNSCPGIFALPFGTLGFFDGFLGTSEVVALLVIFFGAQFDGVPVPHFYKLVVDCNVLFEVTNTAEFFATQTTVMRNNLSLLFGFILLLLHIFEKNLNV